MKRTSTILIADDEPDGREVMAALLRSSDYEMVFAGDGQEVLDQAKAVQPDLILLDVMMPVMD
ncbi:MAG: response regulator, partial [Chloroflexi bacterium]|nr:response regulator [Chloroflexota bacterium]